MCHRAGYERLDVPSGRLGEDDLAVDDLDLFRWQGAGGRAGDHGTIGDLELSAVARAVDGAGGDLAQDASHVRAHRAERPVLAAGRLGPDHPRVRGDLAAA